MKRKTGFYWCNIGNPTGWVVSYFDAKLKQWAVPINNDIIKQEGEMEYFEEIDERILIRKK